MIQEVQIEEPITLGDYAAVAHLSQSVQDLQHEARALVPRLTGRTVWMINSTAKGGGVAEMLPKMVSLLQELGVDTRWLVLSPDEKAFFEFTKRIHNMVHGEGKPDLGSEAARVYEEVSRSHVKAMRQRLKEGDILVVHDPQPLGLGAMLAREMELCTLWRCHIGLDQQNDCTEAAWAFLKPYAETYQHAIFSAPEYIPDFLTGRSTVIHPALDPLSHKNRHLRPHKLTGIICNGGLGLAHAPILTPAFSGTARRLQPDGSFQAATEPDEIGLLFRPVLAQISRWDRLKGWLPLMRGFVRLKEDLGRERIQASPRHRRRLELLRLVLAGPDPASIQDDPEGCEVLEELQEAYAKLDAALQRDVVLVTLPMDSRKNNALLVNALQRSATLVVQNSLREGFGLTATEAMWKGTPVMGTHACGLRHQIRDGVDGRLVRNPEDPEEVASVLNEMLSSAPTRDAYARNGQKHVHDQFLVFTQVSEWLRVLAEQVQQPAVKAS